MQYHCYPNKVHVSAGTIIEGEECLPKLETHIFVSRKPAWYQIPDDGVPRYAEFDEEFERVLGEYVEDRREQ